MFRPSNAAVVVLIDGDQVQTLHTAIVSNRLSLCIQARAICGLQLGAYPNIAKRLGRIWIHPTTVSKRGSRNKTRDLSAVLRACRRFHAQ